MSARRHVRIDPHGDGSFSANASGDFIDAFKLRLALRVERVNALL